MNKSSLSAAIGLAIGTASFSAQASLSSSVVLQFDSGITQCISNDCTNFGTDVTAGSWFGIDADANNTISPQEKTAIAPHDGLHIGFTTQVPNSHSGDPFGASNNYTGTALVQVGMGTDGNPIYETQTITEMPGVDEPWLFFSNTGMHYLTAPVTVVQDNGTQKYLDFSGWVWSWGGYNVPMGNGAWSAGTGFYNSGNGVARILCSTSSCSQTSSFTLDYFATIPNGDPSALGGVKYALHLEGQVSAVPIPAAAWLFGSGLLGLAAAARRRKMK
jgi:hypothetical protein